MFGSKKSTTGLSDQVDTIIGKDTSCKGSINSQGAIRIDGHFEGDLVTVSDVVLGETGRLTAQIKARNAIIAGTVNGNMDIADKLELLSTAKVYGDIKVGIFTVNEGAIFQGACQMWQKDELSD